MENRDLITERWKKGPPTSTLPEKLHKWAIEELDFISHTIPDVEIFRKKPIRKQNRVWTYVINHVRSRATVEKIKRTLYLKKILEANDVNPALNIDYGAEAAKLQEALSRENEKRSYLTHCLSSVKERITISEEKLQNMKDETFVIKQKTALLETVKRSYDEKNKVIKRLLSGCISHEKMLLAYHSETARLSSHKEARTQVYGGVKDLIGIIQNDLASIMKNKFHKECRNGDRSLENLQNYVRELKQRSILLTDFVILLKEISDSDYKEFAAMKIRSVVGNCERDDETDRSESKHLLSQLECKNVYNRLSIVKNKKIIEKLLAAKTEIFESKLKNVADPDCELICTLVEKLAENEALTVSNNHLENCLKEMAEEVELIRRKVRDRKLNSAELQPVLKNFYTNVDLAFYLLYTFTEVNHRTNNTFDGLQSFAHNELFNSPFPPKESILHLLKSFTDGRQLTWQYCNENNIIQSTNPRTKLPSPETEKLLNYQHFQNVGILRDSWTYFNLNLLPAGEVVGMFDVLGESKVSKLYASFLKKLEESKSCIDKGMKKIDEGKATCQKSKSLIQEWWEQNAQYIPYIQHEGKTLKMWLDILKVLTDFEPQNYA